MSETWKATNQELPTAGVVVDTISPGGIQQPLKRQGCLWFHPDGSVCLLHSEILEAHMTTPTTELLKLATPRPWRTHPENKRVLVSGEDPFLSMLGADVKGQCIIWKEEDAELIRRMAASWEAMREVLEQCDKAFACWQVGQIPGRPEEILALIVDLRRALALSNGEEPAQ